MDTGKSTWSYWQCLQAVFQIMQGRQVASIARELSQARAWELASRCAREHRSLPALAAGLQKEPAALADVPQETRNTLIQAHRHNVERNLGIYAQAIKLTETLNTGGILPIFLKGTAILLANAGQDIGRREQIDIDLVVPPDQVLTACGLLQDAGYRFTPAKKDGTVDLSAAGLGTAEALRASQYHHHLIPLVHPERAVAVELHRYSLPAEFNQTELLDELLADVQEHSAHGARFRIPSAEDQIIQLVLGNFVHDGHAAAYRFPLREADDYLRLLGNSAPNDQVVNREKIRKACGSHFHRFESIIDLTSLPGRAETGSGFTTSLHLYILKKRYVASRLAGALDKWARFRYLFGVALHSPGKLAFKINPR